MPTKKKKASKKAAHAKNPYTFSNFISDPLIVLALMSFALIALVLAILEFSTALR